ncbi:hypothetical protein SAMN05216474_0537 [Lishizhenia tianjinensis]|uniref:Outer membrane protein beta-barrel domain-containing protein n=1 Tax=Lishizhenia tianjinensis TaxID=477690 RepID=A0A1I6XZM4_9FLAO|nr:hypothetical protein [Lishizhenia tianjinensis]SFT43304.1 hypothetical protein SAMN05216474_0537 [Lishizhenia tianjinensis]
MKVYKLLIATIVASLGMITTTYAQAPTKGKAVGLRTSNFNNLDLTFSLMHKENKAIRFRAGGLNYNYHVDTKSSTGGLRLAVGFQRFKPINDKFSFQHGFEPAINFAFTAVQGLQQSNTSLALGYMLGFNYALNQNFNIYLETIPALYVNNNHYPSNPGLSTTYVGFNTSSQLIGLGATYNF